MSTQWMTDDFMVGDEVAIKNPSGLRAELARRVQGRRAEVCRVYVEDGAAKVVVKFEPRNFRGKQFELEFRPYHLRKVST